MTTEQTIGMKGKDTVWYDPPLTAVAGPVRDLLENYSHYAPDEVVPRVAEMRDQVWDVFPWPCIGHFRFINLYLSCHPAYPSILSRIQRGGRFLDVGCCMAADVRKLAHDGAPPENLLGLELHSEFLILATDFFRDADRLPADHFIQADLLDRTNDRVRALEGTVDVVQLKMVLHVWDRERQVEACKRLVELLKPETGVMIVGMAMANVNGGPSSRLGIQHFQHNVETFEELWEEVGRVTGTKWDVHATLKEPSDLVGGKTDSYLAPGARKLEFVVERL